MPRQSPRQDSLEDCHVDCHFSVERQICRWESWYLNLDRKQKPQSKHIYDMPTALFPLVVEGYGVWSLDEFTPKKTTFPVHFLLGIPWNLGRCFIRHPGAPANLTHQILHSPDLGNRFQPGHKPKTSHPECRTIVVRSEMGILAISNCDIFFLGTLFWDKPSESGKNSCRGPELI